MSIPVPIRFETIAEAMKRMGLHEIRAWPGDNYTVKFNDGRSGQGKTIREAIDTASHERLSA